MVETWGLEGEDIHSNPATSLAVVTNNSIGFHSFIGDGLAMAFWPGADALRREVVDFETIIVRRGSDLSGRVERCVRNGQSTSMFTYGDRFIVRELPQIP